MASAAEEEAVPVKAWFWQCEGCDVIGPYPGMATPNACKKCGCPSLSLTKQSPDFVIPAVK